METRQIKRYKAAIDYRWKLEHKAFNVLNKIFRKQKTIHNVFFLCKTVYLCMNSTFTQLKKSYRRQQCNELKWLEPLSSKKITKHCIRHYKRRKLLLMGIKEVFIMSKQLLCYKKNTLLKSEITLKKKKKPRHIYINCLQAFYKTSESSVNSVTPALVA